MTTTGQRHQATIEADPDLPIIRITRDFDATPAQLLRAHTDPELFARWVGPDGMDTETPSAIRARMRRSSSPTTSDEFKKL